MQIELVLKDVQMGRYARERVEHKLLKVAERLHREVPVRVVVEDHKGIVRARVVATFNHRDLVGQHECRSVLEAVDEAIVKFDRQLGRLFDRSARRTRGQRARTNGHAAPVNGAPYVNGGSDFEYLDAGMDAEPAAEMMP